MDEILKKNEEDAQSEVWPPDEFNEESPDIFNSAGDRTDDDELEDLLAGMGLGEENGEADESESLEPFGMDETEEGSEAPDENAEDGQKEKESQPKIGFFQKLAAVPEKKLRGIIKGLCAGIICMCAAGAVIWMLYGKATITDSAMLITQPQTASNGANYIYLSCEAGFGDKKLVLQKLLIDRQATVFYFGSVLDGMEYDVRLTDDRDREYALEMDLLKNGGTAGTALLRFGGFDEDVKGFSLTFSDKADETVVADL